MVRISPNPSDSITWQANYGRAACHIPMATSVTESGKTLGWAETDIKAI